MTQENIIRMAREVASKFASWDDWDSNKPASGPNGNEPHEEREYWISVVEFIATAERDKYEAKFKQLEAIMQEREQQPNKPCCLAEREACAKVCEAIGHEEIGMAYEGIALDCAAAIRARKEKQ